MDLDYSLLKAFHMIPWRSVFLVTLCLMAVHTIFINQDEYILSSKPTESPLQALSVPEANSAPPPVPVPAPPNKPAVPAPPIAHNLQPLPIDGPLDHLSPPDAAPDSYIAICMAAKDQGRDLGEYFVHHYHHHGITRFYIMDDGSEPPLSSFEYPGVPRSILTFVPQDQATRGRFTQVDIYARCQRDYGHLHTWIAYLDCDEFLETPGNETLTEILEGFEADDSVGALAVNWKMHGSSGLLNRPESARKAFVDCVSDRDEDTNGSLSDNQHVKVFVRTDRGIGPTGPHMWVVNGNVVGEHGDVVNSPAFRTPITRDRIALHHYATKSWEEYEQKKHRGNAMSDPKDDGFWNAVNIRYTLQECMEMTAYDP